MRRSSITCELIRFDAYARKGQTPNTPAIPLFYAADVQLAAIAAEGMPTRWARHTAMAERTYAWVDALRARHGEALHVLAHEGRRSPTVTSITLPKSLTASRLLKAVQERGFTIGGGYGKNKETTVRIGHMGDHTLDGLERCLSACDAAFDSLLL